MESRLKSIRKKRILLSSLNWGYGHVTRTIPIIKELLANENEVIICCDKVQEAIYRGYFPSLTFVYSEGYPFNFSGNGNWSWDLLRGFSSLNKRRKKERREVTQWVAEFRPDLLISDQRYGFHHPKVSSVFITHQLKLPVTGIGIIAQWLNRKFIQRFNEVWIPDEEGSVLSGELTETLLNHTFYVGIKSRFKEISHSAKTKKYLAVISGPTPYSAQFYKMVYEKLSQTPGNHVMVIPTDVVNYPESTSAITIVETPSPEYFQELLDQSEIVISRAGYTTLLDLTVTGHQAIFIPTKGQKEQLYFSKLHTAHPKWKFLTEEQFNSTSL